MTMLTNEEGNRELDNFFDGSQSNAAPPPPPSFVDKRDFHQATPGGFGNTPIGEMNGAPAAASGAAGGMGGTTLKDLMENPNMQQAQLLIGSLVANNSETIGVVREKWQTHFGNNMRPWRDFGLPIARPRDSKEACSHVQRNMSYFKQNYLLLFMLYFALNVLLSPSSIFTLAFLSIVWVFFLKRNDDPNWETVVGGVSIGASMRSTMLVLFSVLVIFFMCGSLIFSSCVAFAFAALIHAVLHTPPMLEDEELSGGAVMIGSVNV